MNIGGYTDRDFNLSKNENEIVLMINGYAENNGMTYWELAYVLNNIVSGMNLKILKDII